MIKVLVVDDSALMRNIISDMLSNDSEIKVIGKANNGVFALKKIDELSPDVVLMDVEMPEMDGITAIKKIMSGKKPTRVIVLSAFTDKGSKFTLDALDAGAIDFMQKPSGEISLDIRKIQKDLIEKIKAVAKSKFEVKKPRKIVSPMTFHFSPTRKKIIVIGSSTGGPKTLELLLREIPKNIPSPILIVQHMPRLFTKLFAERLNNVCSVTVKEAEEGDVLENGMVYIAPGDFHMEIVSDNKEVKIKLNQDPSELGVRPNINRLFNSVAELFRENTIGVVLTGMGNDGTIGSKTIKEYHGTVIAESEETAIIYGMPKSVAKAGLADAIIPVDKIAVAILQLVDV